MGNKAQSGSSSTVFKIKENPDVMLSDGTAYDLTYFKFLGGVVEEVSTIITDIVPAKKRRSTTTIPRRLSANALKMVQNTLVKSASFKRA